MDPVVALALFLQALREKKFGDAYEHYVNLARYVGGADVRRNSSGWAYTPRVNPLTMAQRMAPYFTQGREQHEWDILAMYRPFDVKTELGYVTALLRERYAIGYQFEVNERVELHDEGRGGFLPPESDVNRYSSNVLRMRGDHDLADHVTLKSALSEMKKNREPMAEFDVQVNHGRQGLVDNVEVYVFPTMVYPPVLGEQLSSLRRASWEGQREADHAWAILINLLGEGDPLATRFFTSVFSNANLAHSAPWDRVLDLKKWEQAHGYGSLMVLWDVYQENGESWSAVEQAMGAL